MSIEHCGLRLAGAIMLACAMVACGAEDSPSGGSGGTVAGTIAGATGGSVATGGAPATGGAVATGGAMATGGMGVVATGGAMATGGTGGMMASPDAGMGTGGTSSTAPDLQMCLDRGMMMGEDPACTMCVCTMCFDQASTVYLNPDMTFSTNAKNLLQCVRTTCCKGQECYCGKDPNTGMVNPLACLGAPMGPCKAEIEAASGQMGALNVSGPCMSSMTTNACGAAAAFGECVQGNAEMMIAGKCPMCVMCPP